MRRAGHSSGNGVSRLCAEKIVSEARLVARRAGCTPVFALELLFELFDHLAMALFFLFLCELFEVFVALMEVRLVDHMVALRVALVFRGCAIEVIILVLLGLLTWCLPVKLAQVVLLVFLSLALSCKHLASRSRVIH